VLEAAKQLKGAATFRMVGSIGVLPEAQLKLREHVELAGVVPRSSIHEHFAWADVFLLPSICEGSATVTYEALASGLPVVCTPNTGSIIEETVQGFIVKPQDIAPLVSRLLELRNTPEKLLAMSRAARELSIDCTVAAYSRRLLDALNVLN